MSKKEMDIDQFLGALNQTPENVDINSVHQLINTPNAQARLPETKSFNTLKTFIMTSSIITAGIIAWLVWPPSEPAAMAESKPIPNAEIIEELVENFEQQEDQPIIEQTNATEEVAKTGLNSPLKTPTKPPIRQEPNITLNQEQDKSEELDTCDLNLDFPLNGWDMVLQMNRTELEQLGFKYVNDKDQQGVFYLNTYNESTVSMYQTCWDSVDSRLCEYFPPTKSKSRKTKNFVPTKFDFNPLYTTDFTMETSGLSEYVGEELEYFNDTLIAISLGNGAFGNFKGKNDLLWFRTSPAFFEALPDRYSDLQTTIQCVREAKLRNPKQNLVNYQRRLIINTANAIELPIEVYEQMGVKVSDDGFTFSFMENSCRVDLEFNRDSYGVDFDEPTPDFKDIYCIKYSSDKQGRQNMSWSCENEKAEFIEEYGHFIPVVLGKAQFPDLLSTDHYLWFEPREEFLKLIPGEIGEQIRQEYEYLISDNKEQLESSCTFFEACRASLHIHDLNLHPNPNRGNLNVTFTLEERITADISISDMNGMEVLLLNSRQSLTEGVNRMTFDVSGLSSGIYLFVIHCKDGFISKRLIVQ